MFRIRADSFVYVVCIRKQIHTDERCKLCIRNRNSMYTYHIALYTNPKILFLSCTKVLVHVYESQLKSSNFFHSYINYYLLLDQIFQKKLYQL